MKSLLQHLVTDQADQRPDSLAVSRENHSLSYKDLEIQSNRLANMLKELGCKRGDRVCFLMPKVPEAIICVAGILKADCIYVPLDVESPVNRLIKIVRKCQPRCILASGPVDTLLTNLIERVNLDSDIPVGWVDPDKRPSEATSYKLDPEFDYKDLTDASSGPLAYKNTSTDPAHIFFTSDSAGEPKGIVTSHQNVLGFIRWAKNYFRIQPQDHLSNYAPFHFDMSSLDIYGALSSGAQLHLVPRDYSEEPHKVATFIRKFNITQWFSTPSILTYMAEYNVFDYEDFPSLERLIWSNEVCPVPTLRYWMERLQHVTFTSLYGPTETTIASTYYTVPKLPYEGVEDIPIGKSCPGETLYVLDEQLNPVRDGETGELYIAGTGLSQGYWDDPKSTSEAFQFNPYVIEGDRIFYKTGDLAHFDENGICFLDGRKDNIIKKDGYRIDPGDIEEAVDSLGLTTECAVVSISEGEFVNNKICCAYVPSGTRNNHLAGAYLEMKLKNLLPDYMIPVKWESYVILPKFKNGKINREALRISFSKKNQSPKPTKAKAADSSSRVPH